MRKKKVRTKDVLKLNEIFVEKKWIDIDGYKEHLERFGHLLECLNDEQTDLVLDLTGKYYWISYNEYSTHLRGLLVELYNKFMLDVHTIYIFPIKKYEDRDRNDKSGDFVMLIIDSLKASIPEYRNIEFVLLNDYEEIGSVSTQIVENKNLLLVDDFIGTGDTLNSTIDEIRNRTSVQDEFVIMSIMILEEAKQNLDKNDIRGVFKEISKKGISNSYEGEELVRKLEVMKDIESIIPKVKKYRLGYGKSEALVTMKRTPNNTFPIFWMDFKKRTIEYKAPFSRY